MSRIAVLVVAAVLSAGALAGCGGSEDGEASDPAPATVTVTAEAEPDAPTTDEEDPAADAEAEAEAERQARAEARREAQAEAQRRARAQKAAERAARLAAAAPVAEGIGEALGDIGTSASSLSECSDYACIISGAQDLSQKAQTYRLELGPQIRRTQVGCLRRTGTRFLSIMYDVEQFDDLVTDPDAFIAQATRVTDRMSNLTGLATACAQEIEAGG